MSDALNPVIAALEASLRADPNNPLVWTHLAELLERASRSTEAIGAWRRALEFGAPELEASRKLIPLLRAHGQVAEALIRAEAALAKQSDAALEAELVRIHLARGDRESAQRQLAQLRSAHPQFDTAEFAELSAAATPRVASPTRSSAPPSAPPAPVPVDADPQEDVKAWASQFDWGDLRVTFDEVVGLDDVKRQIKLRIIAPLEKREVYQAFSRKGGGGILLYGPPGCGKTYIARATAGECGARFVSVGIHEIVDKYFGESEKLVHTLFEEARRRAPTVLFFDEFDALGSARGSSGAQFWKTLVDQLLQEMDGLASRNENLLVFAATNAPWSIDSAFRRPGRFDRQFFVPPPDEKSRAAILATLIAKLPGGDTIAVGKIAQATPLWTGADLKALCDRASEDALERSIESNQIHPVTNEDFQRELTRMESSAQEWLATARNYARYSNEGGQYNELQDYLRKMKRW
ncbi:MAG: AAA family ATPase [Planctomycetota bacterium]